MINMYSSNKKSLKHMKQRLTELKREIDSSIIIVGDLQKQSCRR
jgi:hypothetical protein